jgi:cysteinyl-tRNA synthetase
MARVASDSDKKNPRDFALWKLNSSLGYPSPWGQGFPGWHIECSAMSKKYLGEHFDIHSGGIDLAPIHHNNEIAQSTNACGCDFVNYWLHNAFVNVTTGKMAKSEGTGIRLQTLIEKGFSPLAYRYWLLGAHYRTPMTFSWEALEAAQNALGKLSEQISNLESKEKKPNKNYVEKFTEYVNDDLDTAKGLALLWDLVKDPHIDNAEKRATALKFDEVLGLSLDQAVSRNVEVPMSIQKLAAEREIARKNKDWKRADEIRAEIASSGFEIKDTDSGPAFSPSKIK